MLLPIDYKKPSDFRLIDRHLLLQGQNQAACGPRVGWGAGEGRIVGLGSTYKQSLLRAKKASGKRGQSDRGSDGVQAKEGIVEM